MGYWGRMVRGVSWNQGKEHRNLLPVNPEAREYSDECCRSPEVPVLPEP